MSACVRVDYEVTDLDNRSLLPLNSVWLEAQHEKRLEEEIERHDLFDYPVITDMLEEYEESINLMRRGCDIAGCFNWKVEIKATEYIIIYKLRRTGPKHFKLHGFCLCFCKKHARVAKHFEGDLSNASLECDKCKNVFFSSKLPILCRTSPVCHKCKIASDGK